MTALRARLTSALALLVALAPAPAQAVSLGFSTYLGGTSSETPGNVAVDAAGNVYVAGQTASVNFPATVGALRTQSSGLVIPLTFVTKFSASGVLQWSTYLGGTASGGADLGNDLAVDAAGNVLVTGSTSSQDFPTTPGAFDRTYGGGTFDGFVAKIDASGSTQLEVRNGGTRPASPKFQVRFARSDDGNLDAGDAMLKTAKVSPLAPGATKQLSVKLALPAGMGTTGTSIIALADAAGVVAEIDETNNLAVFGPLP